MDPTPTPSQTSTLGRLSVIDSLHGFMLSGVCISKEELRKKLTFPEYLRRAITEAIRAKDVDAPAVVQIYEAAHGEGVSLAEPAEWPIVVFINSNSGGRHRLELKGRLQDFMGEEQSHERNQGSLCGVSISLKAK